MALCRRCAALSVGWIATPDVAPAAAGVDVDNVVGCAGVASKSMFERRADERVAGIDELVVLAWMAGVHVPSRVGAAVAVAVRCSVSTSSSSSCASSPLAAGVPESSLAVSPA